MTVCLSLQNTRDLTHYSLGMEYPLPDTVAGARILREGGNGLVLEVSIKVLSATYDSCYEVVMVSVCSRVNPMLLRRLHFDGVRY